jgi:hypothetical protein
MKPQKQSVKEGFSTQLAEKTRVLREDGKMVIPTSLQHRAVAWFCNYLQHPRNKHLKETLCLSIYWKGLQTITCQKLS